MMGEMNDEIYKHYYQVQRGDKFDKDCNDDNFWLGPLVAFHRIAEYGFLEYRETSFSKGADYGKLTGRHRFSIYINGYSLGTSASTLDEALVTVIAIKRDGLNTQSSAIVYTGYGTSTLSMDHHEDTSYSTSKLKRRNSR